MYLEVPRFNPDSGTLYLRVPRFDPDSGTLYLRVLRFDPDSGTLKLSRAQILSVLRSPSKHDQIARLRKMPYDR